MNKIELNKDILVSIIRAAVVAEKNNLKRPQTQRLSDMEMISRHMKMIKKELAGEMGKLR